jgi:hypothetical protein
VGYEAKLEERKQNYLIQTYPSFPYAYSRYLQIPGTSPRLINARQVIPCRGHAEQQAENLEVKKKDAYKT